MEKPWTGSDYEQVIRDAHNGQDSALNVTTTNNLVPRKFDKIEITYVPLGESGAGEAKLVKYYTGGLAEISDVFCTQNGTFEQSTINLTGLTEVGLSSKYFITQDSVGSVGVWFDLDNLSTPPTTGALRDIKVSIASGDTDSTIATKLAATLHSDTEFTAASVLAVVAIASNSTGNKVNTADFNTGAVYASVDGSDGLNNKYFYIYSADDAQKYHVWYTDGTGVDPDPDPGNSSPIAVTLVDGDSASNVASKTVSAINATTDFCSILENSTAKVINIKQGPATSTDAGTTGFTINTDQEGSNGTLLVVLGLEYNAEDALVGATRVYENLNSL